MTSVADFLPDFANDTTIRETEATYKRLIDLLREAHRQSMARIVEARDGNRDTTVKRQRSDEDLHTPTVRNWAIRQGMVLTGGRINKTHKEAYRKAHADTSSDAPGLVDVESPRHEVPSPPGQSQGLMVADTETVRQWAIGEGIEFQRVSKNLRAMYEEAHPE